jgi:hypothetical protein
MLVAAYGAIRLVDPIGISHFGWAMLWWYLSNRKDITDDAVRTTCL